MDLIQEAVLKGEFTTALNFISQLSPEYKLRGNMFRSGILVIQGKYQEGLKMATELEENAEIQADKDTLLGALFFKCLAYLWFQIKNFDHLHEMIDTIEKKISIDSSKITDNIQDWIIMLQNLQALFYIRLGDYSTCLKLGEENLRLSRQTKSTWGTIFSIWILIHSYLRNELLDKSLDYCKQGLELAYELKTKFFTGIFYFFFGWLYDLKNQQDDSYFYFNKALEVANGIGFDYLSTISKTSISKVQPFFQGNYGKLIKISQQSLHLAEQREDNWAMCGELSNLGFYYKIKGELTKALESATKSLEISIQLGHLPQQSITYRLLGGIYYELGKIPLALKNYKRSLQIGKNLDRKVSAILTLYQLIVLNIEINNREMSQNYFQQLEELNDVINRDDIQYYYELSKAILLKSSGRIKKQAQAQEIFEKIAESPQTDPEITTIALFQLCDLLIYEYKNTKEEEVSKEVQAILKKIYNIGKSQQIYPRMVQSLSLQAKLHLIEGALTEAKVKLNEAHQISSDKELVRLLEEVTDQQNQIDKNSKTRDDHWKELENYMKKALHIVETKEGSSEKII